MANQFKHLADEYGKELATLRLPGVARVIRIVPVDVVTIEREDKSGKVVHKIAVPDYELKSVKEELHNEGWKIKSIRANLGVSEVSENIYLVDGSNRLVYTNDDATYNKVCYYVPESKEPVCFPKKGVATPPRKVKKEPLDRDKFEEFVIAAEEMLGDDVSLAHFAYYCRTRGGIPLMLNVKMGIAMVCAGGKVDKYGVLQTEIDDMVQIIHKKFGDVDGARAIVLAELGKDYDKVYGKTRAIIPSRRLHELGLSLDIV